MNEFLETVNFVSSTVVAFFLVLSGIAAFGSLSRFALVGTLFFFYAAWLIIKGAFF